MNLARDAGQCALQTWGSFGTGKHTMLSFYAEGRMDGNRFAYRHGLSHCLVHSFSHDARTALTWNVCAKRSMQMHDDSRHANGDPHLQGSHWLVSCVAKTAHVT